MAAILFRCPTKGIRVQSWIADALIEDDTFVEVKCIACRRVHLINPKTEKVLGEEK